MASKGTRYRLWVTDRAGRILEALKVPENTRPEDQMEYLFTAEELGQFLTVIASDVDLRYLSQDRVTASDLQTGMVTLFGRTVIGEADYYLTCKGFVVMVNDPTRARH